MKSFLAVSILVWIVCTKGSLSLFQETPKLNFASFENTDEVLIQPRFGSDTSGLIQSDEMIAIQLESTARLDANLQGWVDKTELSTPPTLVRSYTSSDRIVHTTYKHFYEGTFPVEGSTYIYHYNPVQDTFESTDNIYYFTSPVDLTTNIGPDEAIVIALKHIPACNKQSSLVPCEYNDATATRVVLPVRGNKQAGELVYKVQVRVGRQKWRIFISALTGEYRSGYITNQRGASGNSIYEGVVAFGANPNVVPYYYLEDLSRQIGVFDCQGTDCSTSVYRVSSTDPNNWTDPVAINVHFAASQFLDYMQMEHGRTGMDGYGGPGPVFSADSSITIFPHYIHYNIVGDAIFTEDGIFYGDGSMFSISSPVSIDMVGHEMTHGMIRSIILPDGFAYVDESGAIEEAICDWFGAMTERYTHGESSKTWMFGEDFYTPLTNGDALRYMNDPHLAANQGFTANDNPDHYSELYTGLADNGGVHVNSGIISKALYLLSQGGTHPHGGVTMTGIGADNVSAILYKALTTYFTASMDFNGMRTEMTRAARDLFGSTSFNYFATQVAFGLCGIGTVPIPSPTQLIQNPGLESSSLPWVLNGTNSVFYISSGGGHSSRGHVVLGQNNGVIGSVSQSDILIPYNAQNASLTFWLSTVTTEPIVGPVGDTLSISIKNLTSGYTIATIASFSNVGSSTAWIQKGPFDLLAYRETPIKISFNVMTNYNYPTSFKIDDVKVDTLIY